MQEDNADKWRGNKALPEQEGIMTIEIKNKKTGNCPCVNCGKMQEGWKSHPYTVWHKEEYEKSGHNEPVCSVQCAEELASKLKREA